MIDVNLEYLSPITFRTTLASGLITQPRADTKTLSAFFFLNAPSMQGASGGGIYASVLNDMLYVGTATKLIGVVHGTTSDETGGKLSMNTPSFYVWELLRILK